MKNKILKTLFFVWLLCFWINQSNAYLQSNLTYVWTTLTLKYDNNTQTRTVTLANKNFYFFTANNRNPLWWFAVQRWATDYIGFFAWSEISQGWWSSFSPPCSWYTNTSIDWVTYNFCLSWYSTNIFWAFQSMNPLAWISTNEYKKYFYCTESSEVLSVTNNWVVSCDDNSFWWWLLSWITNWLNSIYNWIESFLQKFTDFANSFNFDFEYTWFNFNISNFYKFLSLNISWNNKPTIYTPTQNNECNEIFTRKMQYFHLDQSGPECYDSSNWSYPNWSFDFVLDFWTNTTSWAYIPDSYLGKYTSNTNFVSRDWPSCSEWNTWVMRQDFKYITNYNNNNLININTAIFDSLNIIPINLIVFNVNVTSYINSTAVYILKLTISIFATPIEFINKLYSSFNLFNLDFKDNTNYCFAGGLWRMPSKANTPSVTISNNTNWVNGAWVELFLFLILAFNCFHTFMKLKKQFN